MLDGIDGRSHYVDIGAADDSIPIGSVVRLTITPTAARQADRTVADIAARSGGIYSADWHRFCDPTASETYIQTHIRRLEAIRSETSGVERTPAGEWRITPDHVERAARFEQQRAAERPVTIETLSAIPLAEQMAIDAPTWLDRQIVHELKHDLAGHGFGRDVHHAMVRRQHWLIEQGLMQRDGADVVYRTDLVDQLRRRELSRAAGQLSQEFGLRFTETVPGAQVEGVYKRPIDLASGRYALIERSLEFSLVPWRPVLEQRLGRHVEGHAIGDSIDWTFGRKRSGPAI